MSRLIEGSLAEGGRIVDDAWVAIETLDAVPADEPLLVTLAMWTSDRERLVDLGVPLGVRLEPNDDPATVADDLRHFALIAIHFPKFTDGRGYSIARLLRERYGYAGKLRAVGDVLRDQLFYLLRCGFDSFALKHDDQLDDALSAYRDFTDAYQTSVDRKTPLFARRGTAAA